jgi:alkanesulfonate monooxygenase SsuD/methylene tetrahydromethanopterin reductase-like flavin-dependent oxidoreductase (luciferase family)
MRKCWRPGPVAHAGSFYDLRSSWVEPKPIQDPLPVFVAAVTPDGIARAAAVADGFMFPVTCWDAASEAVRTYREAGGRGPIALRLNPIRDRGDRALERFAETLSADFSRAVALGADDVHWEFNQSSMTLADQCKAMALIADMA